MVLGPPPYKVRLTYRDQAMLPPGIHANVDTPLNDVAENSLAVDVAGWVAHFANHDLVPPANIVVTVGRYGWLEAPVQLPRPDVVSGQLQTTGRRTLTPNCGFSLLLPVPLVTNLGPYVLSVKSTSVDRSDSILHEFAELQFESVNPHAWRIPTNVNPLIVNSIGRSGSSLLCRMLAQHVGLHVPRSANQFGEVAICDYVARIVSVLSSTGSYASHNRVNQVPDFQYIEPPHFSSRMLRSSQTEEYHHIQFVRDLTDEARRLGQRALTDYINFARGMRPSLRYLVEKSWNSYNINLLNLFFSNVKEVFVVREPSEFMRSQRAFLLKQGSTDQDVENAQLATADRLGNLARAWSDRKETAYLVKYEDLLADPRKVLGSLCDYLGLFRSPEFISAAAALVEDDSEHSQMLRTDRYDGVPEYERYLASLTRDERDRIETYVKEFGY